MYIKHLHQLWLTVREALLDRKCGKKMKRSNVDCCDMISLTANVLERTHLKKTCSFRISCSAQVDWPNSFRFHVCRSPASVRFNGTAWDVTVTGQMPWFCPAPRLSVSQGEWSGGLVPSRVSATRFFSIAHFLHLIKHNHCISLFSIEHNFNISFLYKNHNTIKKKIFFCFFLHFKTNISSSWILQLSYLLMFWYNCTSNHGYFSAIHHVKLYLQLCIIL